MLKAVLVSAWNMSEGSVRHVSHRASRLSHRHTALGPNSLSRDGPVILSLRSLFRLAQAMERFRRRLLIFEQKGSIESSEHDRVNPGRENSEVKEDARMQDIHQRRLPAYVTTN